MTTRITRIESERTDRVTLRLDGALTATDAKLLEEICAELRDESGFRIMVDLAGVDFVGHEGARILSRLQDLPELELSGMHLFVEQMVNSAAITQRLDVKDGEANV